LSNLSFSWKRFLAASFFGILSTLSFSSGFAYWPAVFLLLIFSVFKDKRLKVLILLLWVTITVSVVAVYLNGYVKPSQHPSLFYTLHNFREFIIYVLSYLGALLNTTLRAFKQGIFGVVCFVFFLLYLFFNRTAKK